MSENKTMMDRIIEQSYTLIGALGMPVTTIDTNFFTETVDIEFDVSDHPDPNITGIKAKVFEKHGEPVVVVEQSVR